MSILTRSWIAGAGSELVDECRIQVGPLKFIPQRPLHTDASRLGREPPHGLEQRNATQCSGACNRAAGTRFVKKDLAGTRQGTRPLGFYSSRFRRITSLVTCQAVSQCST